MASMVATGTIARCIIYRPTKTTSP